MHSVHDRNYFGFLAKTPAVFSGDLIGFKYVVSLLFFLHYFETILLSSNCFYKDADSYVLSFCFENYLYFSCSKSQITVSLGLFLFLYRIYCHTQLFVPCQQFIPVNIKTYLFISDYLCSSLTEMARFVPEDYVQLPLCFLKAKFFRNFSAKLLWCKEIKWVQSMTHSQHPLSFSSTKRAKSKLKELIENFIYYMTN